MDHIGPPIARLVTPTGRFPLHPVVNAPEPEALHFGVCGYCGSSPGSAVARCCTAVRCPLVKSDSHHPKRDAA